MFLYQITDWDKHYENNRTRELKRMDWVPMPNHMDGDGYTELMDHPNGSSHLGAWTALVRVASRCDPRGTLLRDNGKPHDFASLSRISRIPVEIFEEAVPRFLGIGWLTCKSCVSDTLQDGAEIPQDGAGIPHDAAPRARAFGTERNGTERNGSGGGGFSTVTELNGFAWPLTLAAARRRFKSTDAQMAHRIAEATRRRKPEASDEQIAAAVDQCASRAKNSAAFFVSTVPEVVVAMSEENNPKPTLPQLSDRDYWIDQWNKSPPNMRVEIEQQFPQWFENGEIRKRVG